MRRHDRLYRIATIGALAAFLAAAPAAQAQKKGSRAAAPANPEAVYNDALNKFNAYNFADAMTDMEKYEGMKNASPEKAEALNARISLGLSMLDRVEKIAVIDSFKVNRNDFFRTYRLSAPTGSISGMESLPEAIRTEGTTSVYTTENGEHKLWAAPGSDGKMHLVESSLLADGSWEQPKALPGAVNRDGADSNFPFLMSDGVTLYYASNDPATSLGGYDIFISRYDGDKYLEPQNIGMPYNSTANDYLMAIDEITGAGWWATDRNCGPEELTVYVFVPSDLRVNYPADTPGLIDLARLTSIAATQQGADHSTLLDAIKAIPAEVRSHQPGQSFRFTLPDGRVLTSFDDFHSDTAADAMETYVEKQTEMEDLKHSLDEMRHAYASGNKDLSADILRAERDVERLRAELLRISNSIISAETSARGK